MSHRTLQFFVLLPWLFSCAGDIKGEAGKDAIDPQILIHRPSFQTEVIGDQTVIVVSAKEEAPARVLIDSTVLANTSDVRCDLSKSGRGGLDLAPAERLTIYYLYAIVGTDQPHFELITSKSPPRIGPNGFSSWSYLGAFATASSFAVLIPFSSRDGRYFGRTPMPSHPVGNTGESVRVSIIAPETAHTVIGEAEIRGNAIGYALFDGAPILNGVAALVLNQPVIPANSNIGFSQQAMLPIYEPQTIYQANSSAEITSTWSTLGWLEDPTEWR